LFDESLDLGQILCESRELFELSLCNLELACLDLRRVLGILVCDESDMLKHILYNVEEEGHILFGLVLRLLMAVRVQLLLSIFKEGAQQQAHAEQVGLGEIQVLKAGINEGAYREKD
jgi:hypothetical protein